MIKAIKNLLGIKINKDCTSDGDDILWENTTVFTPPVKGGRVIKVYDGDTITIATKIPIKKSPIYRFSIRLNGIDTPEMKGPGVTEDEKKAAQEVQVFVSNLILNKYIRLENIKNEKYGRILADVYIGNINLNELLVENRYAVVYNGATKIKPSSWLNYKITGIL